MSNLNEMLSLSLNHYLFLSCALFLIGMTGVLFRRNAIVILMSIELMLNAVNVAFVAFGHYGNNINGQVIVFFVITIAAAEAGVGLALAVTVFKRFKDINIRNFEHLRG